MDHIEFSIISFTKQGNELAWTLKKQIDNSNEFLEHKVTIYIRRKQNQDEESDSIFVPDLKEWTRKQFENQNAILFIGAAGIAVRMISPFVNDKLSDSPVLVMDEMGQYIIPLLSGHVGGANEIAHMIANLTGSVPVITTATDVQGKMAIDVFAKKNNLAIGNREGIMKISSKVLENKKLRMSITSEYEAHVDVMIASKVDEKRALLTLIPREYVIGIGCRKDKETEELEIFVGQQLEEMNISWEQVLAITSIDKKKDEKAIVELARIRKVPFYTYDATTLMQQEGTYTASSFVKQQVGVDNVCERSAMAGCEGDGQLILKKCAKNGMTIAIAKKDWRLTLYEE